MSRPTERQISRDRGLIACAFGAPCRVLNRSITIERRPCRARMTAVIRPTGPAPTTSAAGGMSVSSRISSHPLTNPRGSEGYLITGGPSTRRREQRGGGQARKASACGCRCPGPEGASCQARLRRRSLPGSRRCANRAGWRGASPLAGNAVDPERRCRRADDAAALAPWDGGQPRVHAALPASGRRTRSPGTPRGLVAAPAFTPHEVCMALALAGRGKRPGGCCHGTAGDRGRATLTPEAPLNQCSRLSARQVCRLVRA